MSIVIIGGNKGMECQYVTFVKTMAARRRFLRNKIPIARIHTSSVAALHGVLVECCQ